MFNDKIKKKSNLDIFPIQKPKIDFFHLEKLEFLIGTDFENQMMQNWNKKNVQNFWYKYGEKRPYLIF